jgi:hypothetical protein
MRLLLNLLLGAGLCNAALIVDISQIPPNHIVIDFSSLAGMGVVHSDGPLDFSDPSGQRTATFTSNNPDLSTLGDGSYDLGVNGTWGSPQTYAAIDFDVLGGDAYSMNFAFDLPVSSAIFLMNYRIPTQAETDGGIAYSDVILSAFGTSGLLESYDLNTLAPISTPNGTNVGAYRGILRATPDITSIQLSNAGAIVANLTLSAPDIATATSPVPEPGTAVLVSLSFLLLAVCRRGRAGRIF